MTIRKILREPLVHFLLAAAILYFFLGQGVRIENSDTIVIDRAALTNYIQYRSKSFHEAQANKRLEEMSESQLHELIAQYRREEALYREAMKLGLQRNDFVIRQRLIGKMEFLADQGPITASPDALQLADFFKNNIADYAEPAAVSFTHVFLSGEKRSAPELEAEASLVLTELLDKNVDPALATNYGDRFLFRSNYMDRTQASITNELGSGAAAKIFSANAPIGRWFGPFVSEYGAHLVLLVARSQAKTPSLQEVRKQVVNDYQRSKQKSLQASMENSIVSAYALEVAPDLERWIKSKALQGDTSLVSKGENQTK